MIMDTQLSSGHSKISQNSQSTLDFYIAFQHQVVNWNKMVVLNAVPLHKQVLHVCSS
jgi:hypothetical protein